VKKLLLTLIFICGLLFESSFAQGSNPEIYINNITGPATGQQVTVPINFKNLSNLGAVSIKIIFDTSVLDFVSVTDKPANGTFIVNNDFAKLGGVHDTLSITWFDTSPISYTDGAFANINFTYKGGTGNFHFLPAPVTSLADENGITINNLTLTDGSITTPQILTGSIGDYVWIDANENGIQTPGELPFQNVKVYLLNSNDDSLLDSTSTDSNGNYLFNSLALGTYKIKFVAPDGYVISEKQTGGSSSYLGDSNPDSLTGITDTIQIVSGNLNRYDIDAGMHIYTAPPPPTGSVGDYVWIDSNNNGLQEAGELPLLGVQVKLLDADNNDAVLNTTTTNSSGNYSFNNVVAGNYKVQFVTPTNYSISPKDANNNQSNEGDSDPDPISGKTDAFAVSAGENIYSVDAGMSENQNQQQLGSMGDFVFDDTNHDGMQDSGEEGIPNVTVKLLDSNKNVLQTTTTDQNGNYIFTNLASGNYRLQFSALPGYVFSPVDVSEANNGAYDSEADSTGLTKVLWLNDGENNMTYDAGMYKYTDPQLSSIGDWVFEDSNHDGLQDSGEKGLANVTVKLLDPNQNDNVLATIVTDQNGNYFFDKLTAGNYKLQFIALTGYVFSPQNADTSNNGAYDSEANSSGNSNVIYLNVGENNMTYDAGMYKPVVVEQFPKLFVGIDDGTTTAPDSGKTTVYTISYRNDGSADLLNAVITDTLPSGMSYVKTSNSVSPTVSGNVITVQLGTLGALVSGSFTVEAMTTGMESEYLNKVLLAGVDSKNKNYSESAQDLNYGASTSGGGDSGLESRGDLAEALLRRQLRIQTGTTIPVIAKSSVSGISAQETLDQLVPSVGPYSSTAIVTTPYDILGVSNAVSSYAVDYDLTNSGITRRVAGIFATITQAPDIYDHTKANCDRLEGAEVKEIKLLNINGYKFYAAKVLKADKKIVDYAISFSVYETASGDFVESKWTHDEYQAPNGATSVYNFQIWSGSYENSVQLTEQILAKIKSLKSVTYMNTNQLVPDTYISTVQYTHDGKIHLTIVNNDAEKNVSLNTMYRLSQGSSQVGRTDNFSLNTGTNNLVINSGVIADANIYLDQVNDFKDEAFVSGGAYTYITGSGTTVSSFNTANFPQVDISKYPKDALLLSGGADVSGTLKDYVNVVRSLKSNGSAVDLSNFSSIRFEASGSGELDVLLIMTNTKDNNYYHYSVNLNSTDKEYVINFSDFKELYGSQTAFDASKICDVAFSMNVNANAGMDNFNFEVKNIGFYTRGSVTAVDNVNNIPKEFSLAQNYPNPFNPSTTIQFNVAKQEHITLVIYNLLGKEVKKLVDGEMNVGKHSITFNANNLASGIYFYKLIGNSVNITKKMILMK